MNKYELVAALLDAENYGAAAEIIQGLLENDPDDSIALNFKGVIHLALQDEATAYQYLKRSIDIRPDASNLTNFGKCLTEMGREAEAINWFFRAAEMNPEIPGPYANASAALVRMSDWENALKAAELALDCDPNHVHALTNKGHCLLALGDNAGFDYFDHALGGPFRKEWVYGDEKRWNGEYVDTLVIYGEQGLGDEIFYAAWINDAIGKVGKVIIDCDPKLAGLFKRSFPSADVYGTRRSEELDWLDKYRIDARCAIGSLPRYCERQVTPYLVADPERVLMWESLFASWKKPVFGIALSGGTKKNNAAGRKVNADAFRQAFEPRGAVLLSLEYRDDHQGMKAFPAALQSADYDDTAAMIAAMDAVVGICTTSLHCADALGVDTWTLVPDKHNWRFADGWQVMTNQHFIHQNKRAWKDVIHAIRDLPAATRKAA